MKTFSACSLGVLLMLLSSGIIAQQKDYTAYVNPFIGTGGHGHTFPGATVPFGMVQLSPDTRDDGSWDGCGGYHYSDSLLFGFSHTHLSGTGCSDYGDILLMPVPDTVSLDKKYSASFHHANEKAAPGYYEVTLGNGIKAALSATTRAGIHQYVFPSGLNPAVLLDLIHRDKVTEGYLKIVDKQTIEGFRRSNAWAKDQVVYFRLEFSKPFIDYKMISDSLKKDKIRFHNEYFGNLKALFRFDVRPGEQLLAKVSISGVDPEGARKNMTAEIPAWDFEKVRTDAKDAWNRELAKIDVTGATPEQQTIFYTALYHCFIQPNIYNDVDGRYRGRDFKIHTADGFDYYTVFSLWDTFRAWHPLMTIINRKRTLDFIKTFLAQYEQGGMLPVWELSSNETECMIGYHSVSVIADAAVKGISGYSLEKALEAMKKSAESRNRFGLGDYIEKGMIETDDEGENVSRTLEYAYDDWCIAQVAALLKKQDDYKTYMARSQSWKNLFDPASGFIRPRKNGGWYEPFDAREVNNNYTEANAWQYTFFVPHEVGSLIAAMGGTEHFETKLDEMFTTDSKTTGREQSDITGLIGQYAHGNEPSHHMAYLYNYIGMPWKTQQRVHQILNDFYHPDPDGLIGNEDCGQMSAWYVMSAMGLYQVCPGLPDFDCSVALFPKTVIHLENGKTFEIHQVGTISPLSYIRKSTLNRKPRTILYRLNSETIQAGGSMVNVIETYQPGMAALPETLVKRMDGWQAPEPLVTDPLISGARTFRDQEALSLASGTPASAIHYTLDGTLPGSNSPVYDARSPVMITSTTTAMAIAIAPDGKQSKPVIAHFLKMPHPDWKVTIKSKYDNQYTAGGDEALIDGLYGDVTWRKGYWQGYQAQDFECIVDLGKEEKVGTFSARFLQDVGAWIMFPKSVEFSFSTDGVNFSGRTALSNSVSDRDETVQVKDFKTSLYKPVDARYVRIVATSYGKLPPWHLGAGGDSWLFIDEVSVN